jgi:glycosyltransferase involved in cell wall biosynthesis
MQIWLANTQADTPEWHALIIQLAALGQLTIISPGESDIEEQLDTNLRTLHFATRRHHLDSRTVGQTEHDPAFPYNLMAPPLALSYELAEATAALCEREGPPDLVLCAADQALPYFLLQRCLTNMHPLQGVPLVAVADQLILLDSPPDRQSLYRLPRYWIARLERFCMLGADAILLMRGTPAAFIAAIPHLATPCVPFDQAAARLPEVVRAFHPRTAFPSNTLEAQGAALPPSPGTEHSLLSVVVPFYNLGAFVGDALNSLAASTYRPLEVLVVDDGSRADERAMLDVAAARHPDLVRIISRPNAGLAQTRNVGAEAAHGEFVAFLDADDLVDPAYFEQAIAVLRRHTNVSFVSAWVRLFGAIDACVPTWNPEFPFLLGRNMLLANTVLRRADFLTCGRNDPAIAPAFEDHEAWIRMLARGCVGVSLPKMLVSYRVRETSMLRSAEPDTQLWLAELIAARHPQIYQRYGLELFALQNANGSALLWNHPGTATIDYRERATAAETAYQRLRGRLAFLDPVLGLARKLRG